jgi:RNA polymerase sigma-70 factor (ECF subfamily)
MPALEQLYDAHAQALYAFALDLSRNEADAADILQEIFCRIAAKPSLMRGVRDERAFLLRMVYTRVVDASRRKAVRRRHAENEQNHPVFSETEDPDENEFRERLERALNELPAEQRAVVHLKLWQGLTFEKIAEMLAIPANTAASRYRYGLDKLRALLRPLYEEIQ